MGGCTTLHRFIEKREALGIDLEVTGKARIRVYRAEGILKAIEEAV